MSAPPAARARPGPCPTASIGVHTAPRANTRIRRRAGPVRLLEVVDRPGPKASSRKPIRPASSTVGSRTFAARDERCKDSARRACAATSAPRAERATRRGPSDAPRSKRPPRRSLSRSGFGSGSGVRAAHCVRTPWLGIQPRGPGQLYFDAADLPRRADARRASTDSTPSSPSIRGRSTSSSIASRRRRSSRTARQGPTTAGPCKAGSTTEQHRAEERRLRSATRRVRQRARGRRRSASSGARARQWITSSLLGWRHRGRRGPQAPSHRQPMRREHRVALEHELAVEIHIGDRPIPSRQRLTSSPAATAAPKLVRNHQSSLSKSWGSPSRQDWLLQGAGGGAGNARREPVRPVQLIDAAVCSRRCAGGLPFSGQCPHLLALNTRARTSDRRDQRLSRRRHRAAP